MIYYTVIDTNVLVSGMLKKPSIPNDILSQSLVGDIVPLINEVILSEYKEVTSRPKFHFPKEPVERLINNIIKRCVWINPEHIEEELPDPKDRIFYETVIAGRRGYSAYLITGNQKHFPEREFILTPHHMLDILKG